MIKNKLFEIIVRTDLTNLYTCKYGKLNTIIIPIDIQKNTHFPHYKRLVLYVSVRGTTQQFQYKDEYYKARKRYVSYEIIRFNIKINEPTIRRHNVIDAIQIDEQDPFKFIKSIESFTNSDLRNISDLY